MNPIQPQTPFDNAYESNENDKQMNKNTKVLQLLNSIDGHINDFLNKSVSASHLNQALTKLSEAKQLLSTPEQGKSAEEILKNNLIPLYPNEKAMNDNLVYHTKHIIDAMNEYASQSQIKQEVLAKDITENIRKNHGGKEALTFHIKYVQPLLNNENVEIEQHSIDKVIDTNNTKTE